MSRRLRLLYQWITVLSDAPTGLLLLLAPSLTLRLMSIGVSEGSIPFLRFIGAFVLSTGIACLVGVRAISERDDQLLRSVWLLTALTRTIVSATVLILVARNELPAGWLSVSATDGLFAFVQWIGLAKGWWRDA